MGTKPGILAGDVPVCRLPEGVVGEAYGALIVAAVNALPDLITTNKSREGAPAAATTHHYSNDVREHIEQQISTVLAMRPGAKGSSSIWSRLIWTNIKPHLVGPISIRDNNAPDTSMTDIDAERVCKDRRDAVLQFTCFIAAQIGSTPIECEADVTQLFNRWESTHNS